MGTEETAKSRKELRKESRLAKNKKKFDSWVQHHSKKSSVESKPKHSSEAVQDNPHKNIISKPTRVHSPKAKTSSLKSSGGSTKQPHALANSGTKRGLKRKMVPDTTPKSNFFKLLEMDMGGQAASAEEDLRLEKRLAKKLRLKNGKLGSANDDLGMLLEGIPSAFDSLGSKKSKKANPVNEDLEDEILDESGDEEFDSLASSEEEEEEEEDDDDDDDADDDDDDNDDDEEEEEDGLDMLMEGIPSEDEKEQKAESLATEKYVAPHLRSQGGNESAEHAQLRKRVRGLLNRLSETNVESIATDISNIYQSAGRTIGSQILCEEVIASCSGGPRGNAQYAAVFAGFVSGITCLVGVEFGAKLLARLAKCFEEEYSKEDNLSLRNLTLLFSYLYVFGLCSSDLIYDFLIMLGKRLTEVDVSTVVTVLECCGMKLRGDDPAEMKNFISSVQRKANELRTSSENGEPDIISKRMEFMLETIRDVKNNKTKPKEDTAPHSRIKKWLQKLSVEDLSIQGLTWGKLLDPRKKGQWWLSGDIASTTDNVEDVAGTIDMEITETKQMLQLAASQRMNTKTRKAIFCVVMGGDDYIDAFEKLLRLDLPGKQDREIMRVIVDCCLHEKVFNKYYCVLASKLCSHDKNHKFTLQYCLWDHFKALDSMPLINSMHLAKFTAEMIGSFSLSLAVLKAVELNDLIHLSPKKIMHFRILFEAIFEFPDKLVWNIFTRIAATPEYEYLRSGLEFFINNYVVRGQKSLATKFKIVKKSLNNIEGILM